MAIPALPPLLALLSLAAAPPVEFNRDIRPILSDHCFQCHGPDKTKRKGGLRLDTEEGARSSLAPGKPDESELYKRIISKEDGERMPPRSGRPLSSSQVDLLKRWIAEGAKWQKHWAFIPPRRPAPPLPHSQKFEIRNSIDAFIQAKLRGTGLEPSPEADRATLLRRVTLDLTGLPPTPQEIRGALSDPAPDWYEKVVERLLASPRFGEHQSVSWLDAARYADSNGYQSDGERFMWRWRDWVLDALNRNMPFDQFTLEQLAGDLLPSPTLDQRIATGFNRNHRGNAEGGIIPEEYAVEYVVDRVDTTMAVWQGLTFGCARCHEHKYDPISQREYYQLFAFFNNVPERGRAIKYGNSPPMIPAPTRQQQEELRRRDQDLVRARAAFQSIGEVVQEEQARWEKSRQRKGDTDWAPTEDLILHLDLNASLGKGRMSEGQPTFSAGRLGKALTLDGKSHLNLGDTANFGFYDRFSLSAWVRPGTENTGTILSRVSESPRGDGYALRLEKGRVQLTLTKRWLDDALRVETETALVPGQWRHILATYDGSRLASGVRIYIDGQPRKLRILLDELNQSFDNQAPLRIGAGGGDEDRFTGGLDEVRVYGKCLTEEEALILSTPETLPTLAGKPAPARTPAQGLKLRTAFLETAAPERIQKAFREFRQAESARAQLVESFPSTMVMEELPTPRETFLLQRGQYDRRGEKVSPGVPEVLSGARLPAVRNRLDLARWLVSPDNPLTARVMVNRYWQHYFGVGLVKTPEDFGSQGEAPSHQELLDWLAVEFRDSGWDVKRIHRLIVTSATYRQSSKVTPQHLQKDPANRLLARAPRLRLLAETVRDQALFASGLLVERLGGPSVKTYQPSGLWEEVSGVAYTADRGEALYRRSLYIFWKRTVTPPSMATFDATAREDCRVNRARTNTPLQALALLNDVPYVESSRVLAERLLREASTPEDRLKLAFLRLTGRAPRPTELEILRRGLEQHRAHYRGHEAEARKLVGTGATPPDPRLDVREVAAYTAVTSLILNLDEVITRE